MLYWLNRARYNRTNDDKKREKETDGWSDRPTDGRIKNVLLNLSMHVREFIYFLICNAFLFKHAAEVDLVVDAWIAIIIFIFHVRP